MTEHKLGEVRESGNIKMNNRLNKRTSHRSGGCLGATMFIVPIAIIVIFIGIYLWRSYNGIIEREETMKKTWADVEAEYKRRADLVDKLVKVVEGYADFEKSTLTDVINARKAPGIEINADELNDENLLQIKKAQTDLSSSLSKLMLVVEQYPNLKADQQFMTLQNQLIAIEQAILEQHKVFNAVVQDYNENIRKFPKNIVASIFGFQEVKASFDIEKDGFIDGGEGAENAPDININISNE
ncbi:MAG: LemA family protein [Bacteroidales bacterium]|nr:LemA family protein [Bacteroidales bacterium]